MAAANLHDLAEIYLRELGDLRLARGARARGRSRSGEPSGTPDEIAHALSTSPTSPWSKATSTRHSRGRSGLTRCCRTMTTSSDAALEVTLAETYRRSGDERNAAARLRAAAEKTLAAWAGQYLVPRGAARRRRSVTDRSPTEAARLRRVGPRRLARDRLRRYPPVALAKSASPPPLRPNTPTNWRSMMRSSRPRMPKVTREDDARLGYSSRETVSRTE